MRKPHDSLTRCKDAYDKMQHPYLIQTLSKLGIEGNVLNLIKGIYKTSTADIILIGKKLNAFPYFYPTLY